MTEKKARAREWKTFRKRHLFTQNQLAAVLGISRRCITNVENGKVVPHTVTLGKFEVLKQKHTRRKEISWDQNKSQPSVTKQIEPTAFN